jgi:hypothetical protein
MEPQDWISLAAIISTAAIAIAGYIFTYNTEQRRAQREDKAEQCRWEREDQTRFHNERREAYSRLRAATIAYTDQIEPQRDLMGQISQAYASIEIIASPEVRTRAWELARLCLAWGKAHHIEADSEEDKAALRVISGEEISDAAARFADAARRELGIE